MRLFGWFFCWQCGNTGTLEFDDDPVTHQTYWSYCRCEIGQRRKREEETK